MSWSEYNLGVKTCHCFRPLGLAPGQSLCGHEAFEFLVISVDNCLQEVWVLLQVVLPFLKRVHNCQKLLVKDFIVPLQLKKGARQEGEGVELMVPFTGLQEYCPQRIVQAVALQDKGSVWVGNLEDWGCGECSLQVLKRLLAACFPQKQCPVLGLIVQRT